MERHISLIGSYIDAHIPALAYLTNQEDQVRLVVSHQERFAQPLAGVDIHPESCGHFAPLGLPVHRLDALRALRMDYFSRKG
jgi:hypothetical protein